MFFPNFLSELSRIARADGFTRPIRCAVLGGIVDFVFLDVILSFQYVGEKKFSKMVRDRHKNNIWIGNDHGGYEMKLQIIDYLEKNGYKVNNIGSNSCEIVRYPYFA